MRALALSCAVLLLGTLGCSESKSTPTLTDAEITVTINGQPLPNALVTLTPTDSKFGGDAIASGVTDDTGKAKLTVGGKAGACVGTNKVTIVDAPPPDDARGDSGEAQAKAAAYQRSLKNRPIPAQYGIALQSDITVEIKKDQKEYKAELKR